MEVTDAIGRFGRYQFAVVLMTVVRAFPTAFANMLTPFLAPDIDHWCKRPKEFQSFDVPTWRETSTPVENFTSSVFTNYSHCAVYRVNSTSIDRGIVDRCYQWEYNSTFFEGTMTEEFNLVCDNRWQRSLLQGVVMVGAVIGALFFGWLSDRRGRLPTFLIGIIGGFLAGSGAAYMPSVLWFSVLRFVAAMSIAGIQISSLIILLESVGPQHRCLIAIGYGAAFSLALILLPPMARIIQSWSLLQLISGLSCLTLIPFWWILQESPRWLIATRQRRNAENSLQKIMNVNKRPVLYMEVIMSELMDKLKSENAPGKVQSFDFFRSKQLRKNTLILFFLGFAAAVFYFGAALSSVSYPKGSTFSFKLSTAAEVPGSALCFVVIRYFSRRISLALFFTFTGLSHFAASFISTELVWANISIMMLTRFLTVPLGLITWVTVLEIFPTTARGFGFACCFTCSRLGGVLASFITELDTEVHFAVTPIIMGILGLCSGGLTMFLPETNMVPLPDTFKESELIGNREPLALSMNNINRISSFRRSQRRHQGN